MLGWTKGFEDILVVRLATHVTKVCSSTHTHGSGPWAPGRLVESPNLVMFIHFPLLWLFEKRAIYSTTESLLNKAFFTSSRVRQSPSTPRGPQLPTFWVKVRLWPQLASCADAIPRRNNSCEDGVDGMWHWGNFEPACLRGGKLSCSWSGCLQIDSDYSFR